MAACAVMPPLASRTTKGEAAAGSQASGLVTCRLADLRPHPALAKHGVPSSFEKMASLAARGDAAFHQPLTVTHTGTIIGDYALWELARSQGHETLLCHERFMTDEEALAEILAGQTGAAQMNSFLRILLALELEPWLKQRAAANRSIGGKYKQSSNLTEADRIDVRSALATTAGVSAGNISKVKKILSQAAPAIVESLKTREVSINLAADWCCLSQELQLTKLKSHRSQRGLEPKISKLIRSHSVTKPKTKQKLLNLRRALRDLRGDAELEPIAEPLLDLLTQVEQRLRDHGKSIDG